jgi:hypothetical protein
MSRFRSLLPPLPSLFASVAAFGLLATFVVQTTRAQSGPPLPFPIVFVSRQIPNDGTTYWSVPKDQPGVGGHSRFRPAAPGKLLIREMDGSIRTLIDGAAPSAATLNLIDVNAPDVSYDGNFIVFAGLPAGSHPTGPVAHPGAWRIYLISRDGSFLRQVSPEEDRSGIAMESLRGCDDTDPIWLPDGRIVFTSTRYPSYAQYSGVRTTNLYVVASDQSGLRRITSERNGADRPLVDPVTGKIVYSRWWRNHRFAVDDASTTVVDPNGGFIQKDGLSADRSLQMDGTPAFADYLWRNAWHAASINPDGTNLTMWGGAFRDEEANHVYGGAFSPDGTLFANFFPMYNMTEAGGFGGIRKFTRGPNRYTRVAGVTDLTGSYASPSNPTSYGVFSGQYVTEPEVLPDGRLIVSVAANVNQDYGLYTMNADGSGMQPLFDVPGFTELRARALRSRPKPPVLADIHKAPVSRQPPAASGPYDGDGTFVFDALNVYFNAAVDTDIVSAPPIGSAATLRFFIDHQRTSPGSFPNRDWPILLKSLPVSAGGAVRDDVAPANVPLFEQVRSADGKVPLTGGPYRDGAAHVAGMNFAPARSVARCVGCHTGHTMIPVPSSLDAAKWTNLAPGARIDVSSTRDARYNGGLIDRRVLKGENFRYWTAANGQHQNQWARLTFPVPVKVRTVRLYNPRSGGEANSSIAVQNTTVRLFSDEEATQEIAAKESGALTVTGTDIEFTPVVARAVRVDIGNVTGTFYGERTASLAEIEVIATGDIDAPPPPDPTADTDTDGMPNGWEANFGLNPGDSSDATADPDGDGVQNKDEYLRGSHPRGTHTRYFAEGSANGFFQTTLALLNPGDEAARVVLRFLKSDGVPASHTRVIAAHSRATIVPADIMGTADFSTVVESDREIVADRTMTWAGEARYGSHAEGSIASPGLTWYLAEGATHGAFDLYYLLQNPNDTDAQVRVRYLLPDGAAPIEKTYTVPRASRRTIWVDDETFEVGGSGSTPQKLLGASDVSAVIEVTNNQPIVVERAMYMTRSDEPYSAGHDSAGVQAAATRWFLAEGATGPFFDMFVLLANPSASTAQVRITYLLNGGGTRTRMHDVAANSRMTVNVAQETFDDTPPGTLPLASETLSAVVESINDVPIIVERSMWWPSFSTSASGWVEAHNSPGTTQTGLAWALAGGELDATRGQETFILIANTSPFAGKARVRLMYENGETMDHEVALEPNSRTTVSVRDAFPLAEGRRFGAVITSLLADGAKAPAQLVVERAMYAHANGITWASGTNLLGTKLR